MNRLRMVNVLLLMMMQCVALDVLSVVLVQRLSISIC